MKTNLSDMSRPAMALVCSNDAVFCGHLERLLPEIGVRRVVVAQCSAEAISIALEQPPDLFVCLHDPPELDGVELVTALRKKVWVPVLLAARNWSPALANAAITAGTATFLTSQPVQAELHKAIHEASARLLHEEALLRKLQDLEQQLADRKLIEKAKGILMEQKQISEDAAFRLMRSQSMALRISMAKLAEGVLTKTCRPGLP